MYHRILVPLDGSPTAEAGLRHAIGLASALKAKLVLLHVMDDFALMMEMSSVSAAPAPAACCGSARAGLVAKQDAFESLAPMGGHPGSRRMLFYRSMQQVAATPVRPGL